MFRRQICFGSNHDDAADGISIPSSYTAHLAPLSSSKLYNEARIAGVEKSLETPYVVMFSAVNILSGDGGGLRGTCGPQIQECWEFEHPRRDLVVDSRGEMPLCSRGRVSDSDPA
jgi:protein arginine N-methyltransferase 5